MPGWYGDDEDDAIFIKAGQTAYQREDGPEGASRRAAGAHGYALRLTTLRLSPPPAAVLPQLDAAEDQGNSLPLQRRQDFVPEQPAERHRRHRAEMGQRAYSVALTR